MIEVKDIIVVTKGCRARGIQKGDRAQVRTIAEFERGVVRVNLAFRRMNINFYCHHNRLGDPEVPMNDGNPTHRIIVQKYTGKSRLI